MKAVMDKGFIKYIILGAAVLLVIFFIVLGIKGCGVSHKSPEHVVEDLVKASVEGKIGKMEDCYAADKDSLKILKKEFAAETAYYKAHSPKKMEIVECRTLYEEKKYAYVYVTFNLVLANEEKYPCIDTYMVEKKENGYYILPPSAITEELSKRAAAEYAQFMTTEAYKDYTNAYDAFTKKNPGYEEKIAGKIG